MYIEINALPDDGVTVTPKHVGAVLMYILILCFLRELTFDATGRLLIIYTAFAKNVKKMGIQ